MRKVQRLSKSYLNQIELSRVHSIQWKCGAPIEIQDEDIVWLYGNIKGDLDTKSGADATEYISHMLKWEDKFLDEPIDKLKGILNSPSYNRFMFIEHS